MKSSSSLEAYEFIDTIKALPFVKAVYLYGSRARGDHQERADIDLAVDCPKASSDDWLKVMDIVENADTLLKIDCIRYDEITDKNLLNNIDRDKKPL